MSAEASERVLVDLSPAPLPGEGETRVWAADQSVFVSSVMGGMKGEREAAVGAITVVGAVPVVFEAFGGVDDDPEDAYLARVAGCDIYLGILGQRYGKPLKSGYSATHAEYNEAVRRGLRISVWAAAEDTLDGPQRDFLEAVRVFHTTGSYSSPDVLAARVEQRLRVLAGESLAPWAKVGNTVFRATSVHDDGKCIIVTARIRDNTIAASLEARRPSQSYGRNSDTRITWPGGTANVRVTGVQVEIGAARVRTFTISADRVAENRSTFHEFSAEGRSAEELTELAMRIALFAEENPLGSLGFMVKTDNPLPAIEGLGLSEDSFEQVAALLLTETLVGERGVDHITTFRLGPKRNGLRRLLLGWMPARRYTNVEPVEHQIDGEVVGT